MLQFTLTSKFILVSCVVFNLSANYLHSADYFVATDGDDQNPGTIDSPFASIQNAQRHAAPGDTVYIRGGKYTMLASQIARKERIWAYVIHLNKSGREGQPINYWAYEDETPVFDFSQVKPADYRVHAFSVSGSWLHLRGIEVVGVQVTIKRHTQSICFESNGSHNIFERLSMHDGQAIGIYSVRGSDNLFLNCDAYRNYDYTSENGRGGNVDGFGCHGVEGATGNVFRGCRAWFNSDDGFDCITASESVRFENCWAFWNGYSPDFERRADGNGFKIGGFASAPIIRIPNPVPRHEVINCLAVRNKNSGFYGNHHIGGGLWDHNTAFGNGVNFNMLSRTADNQTDVPGYNHTLTNNLSFGSRRSIANIDESACEMRNNSFGIDYEISRDEFISLDQQQLLLPRQANGALPNIEFMKPVSGSQLQPMGIEFPTAP